MSLALHQAARSGQLQVVEHLLAEGANVDATDELGMTPLFLAASEGHTQVVQALLAAGGSVSAVSFHGYTPLFAAALQGEIEVAQLLLAAGADVNASHSIGRTPLHAAAEGGHTKMVQLLLRAGANVNAARGNGATPLFLARGEVLQLLLCKGANPQLRADDGFTALYWRAYIGATDTVQLLLEAWGQPAVTAADLIQAAKAAARNQYIGTFVWLAKELQKLYPAELHQLFEGQHPISPAAATAAVLDAWASDVSSLDKQWAAVRRREEDVACAKQAVQQLIVGMAGMATSERCTTGPCIGNLGDALGGERSAPYCCMPTIQSAQSNE